MSAGQEFWIVATGCATVSQEGGAGADNAVQAEKDSLLKELQGTSALSQARARGAAANKGPLKFEVPDGSGALHFSSFDSLIRLTDDLQKHDSQVDGVVHRLERQYLELDPSAEFRVQSQRQEWSFMDYLQNWRWDEAKYPKTRSISDNVTLLMSVVNKLDEEARNKTAQYNEIKTQKANMAAKENANLTNRDLIDVLTPDNVKMNGAPDDDFILTEHLVTVPVILPRGGEQDFLKIYESMQENIVPMSAKKFKGVEDKDGNSLWRVVMFKSAAEGFKKTCREKRFLARDFEYSEESYRKLKAHREQLEEAVQRQHQTLRGLYRAAWSDAMVAWVHIKAMRIFVESVLRFGMPPRFAAFIVSPQASNAGAARKALGRILDKSGQAGPAGAGYPASAAAQTAEEGDLEDYPYVSLSFMPFVVPRSAAAAAA